MSDAPLTVSIVAGPSAAAAIKGIGRINPKIRLGLLTSSRESENSAGPVNLVERLPTPDSSQGHDPARIIEQIRAIAARRVVDHLLLECDAETPVMAFASLFVPQGDPPESLSEVARLTTTVLALSPSLLLDKMVHRVGTEDPPFPCFLADQLEFVTAVVLEEGASGADLKCARDIVMTLNPRATVSELSPDGLETSLLNTGSSFDFASALDSAGWRQLIDDQTDRRRDRISAFAYCSRKPFHPERFWNFLLGGLPRVFRGKGFFWLATRMDQVGGLNLAGAESHHALAGNWWAARDNHSRELHMPERTGREWREPYGDRRQAIALMGIDLDPEALRTELDACLLTEAEMAAGPENWEELIDPFPAWGHHHHSHDHECEHDHHHECGHDHDHGSDAHDCCHH